MNMEKLLWIMLMQLARQRLEWKTNEGQYNEV